MDETIKQELERLIEEGQYLSGTIKYQPPHPSVIRTYAVYTVEDMQRMQNWIDSSETIIQKFFDTNYQRLEFTRSSIKSDHSKLLSKLNTSLKFSISIPDYVIQRNDKEKTSGMIFNINNTQSQNQSQEQSQSQKILQEVFLETIKDKLTGEQVKEIKAILEEHKDNIEEAKPKLLDKLAGFGKDVLAGVLVNVITNPNLIGLF